MNQCKLFIKFIQSQIALALIDMRRAALSDDGSRLVYRLDSTRLYSTHAECQIFESLPPAESRPAPTLKTD